MEEAGETLRIALPRRMKLRGGRSWTSFTGAAPEKRKVDPALIDALKRAHILAAESATMDNSEFRRRLRRLAFLAPGIQRQAVEGRLPAGVGLSDLLHTDPPLRWSEQERWLATLASVAI